MQLVRIKADDFAKMLDEFPEVAAAITEVARARRQMDLQLLGRVQQVSLGSFLEQELMQGQNLLLLDLNKCTRCDECVKACVATHDDGVTRLIRDGLRFEKYLVADQLPRLPGPALHDALPGRLDPPQGHLDIVIEDWCIGCGNCATDCPYGNINVVEVTRPDRSRRPSRGLRPSSAICAPISRSPTACAPARTTPRSGWSRRPSSRATWRACS